MSNGKAAKKKNSFWQTVREAWGPYRRLYSYVKPYKSRFGLGLGFGVAFALLTSLLPLNVLPVSTFVFHAAAPNPRAIFAHREMLHVGRRTSAIAWFCLA